MILMIMFIRVFVLMLVLFIIFRINNLHYHQRRLTFNIIFYGLNKIEIDR
jgi:hypothetical protein